MKKEKKKIKFRIEPLPSGYKFTNPHALIATWFGSGLLRPAPGTMGSLAAIPFGFAINYFYQPTYLLLAVLLLIAGSIYSVHKYGKAAGEHDNQSIVVDEVIGIWIAGIPAYANPYLWVLAFLLFRFFDIKKVWPASFFDRKVPNAFGVIFDDVIAGIYAMFGVSIISVILIS